MANGASVTKTDLQDQIEDAIDVLDDAYAPESNREELDILRGEEQGETGSEDDDED
jgi:hypothetical protein